MTTGAHAVGIAALMVTAFWKIEKLAVTERPDIRMATQIDREPPGGPPPGAKLTVERPRPRPKVEVKVPVQPEPIVKTEPQVAATGGGGEPQGPPGGGGTNPGGDPDSELVGTGGCATPPCGETKAPPARTQDQGPPRIDVVPPKVAAGLRIGGDTQIYPPDAVRVAMVRDDRMQVMGTFKICVSEGGRVDSVTALRSTGYDEYDAVLARGMRAWRYRPYTVNGHPAPMCTVETVIYRMTR